MLWILNDFFWVWDCITQTNRAWRGQQFRCGQRHSPTHGIWWCKTIGTLRRLGFWVKSYPSLMRPNEKGPTDWHIVLVCFLCARGMPRVSGVGFLYLSWLTQRKPRAFSESLSNEHDFDNVKKFLPLEKKTSRPFASARKCVTQKMQGGYQRVVSFI